MILSFQDFQYCCRLILQVYEEQIAKLDGEDIRLSQLAHSYSLKQAGSRGEDWSLYRGETQQEHVEFRRVHAEFFGYLAEADFFVSKRDELYRVRDSLRRIMMYVTEQDDYTRYWNIVLRDANENIASPQQRIMVQGGYIDMNGFHPHLVTQDASSRAGAFQQLDPTLYNKTPPRTPTC